jgi:adenylate cyclase
MPAQENPSEKVRALTSFKALTKLRLLILNGLKDSKNIPDESISLRVRRTHFDDYFRVGVVEYCGRDMLFDKFEGSNRNFLDLDNDYMLGFFDGYGSDVVSYYLKDSLAEAIMYEVQRLRAEEDLAAALRRGFLTCNRDLSMPSTQIVVGASATVLYLLEDRLYVASVGDSMAVISREGQAIVANEKHHCWNRSEQSRIRNLGGNISTDGLVERELAITRGFGFHHLLPYVNANPFIGSFKVADDGKDEFVIVASQSFWKFVRYQVAVDIARALRETPELAVVRLRDTALAYGATKSLSVMMLCLNKLGARGPAAAGAPTGTAAAPVPPSGEVEKRRRVRGSVEDRTLARLEAEIPPPKPPCAIVFTDIRESTKLWEKDPNAMRAANKLHNQLLRRLLRHYRGYEVKNEGDAFMVVFETVGDAVRWGMSVQEHLLEADWPQEILNNPIASPVAGPDGRLLYRGLSVRMGVHYGMAISEQDIVTHRMDYFGVDVITASRICDAALGGQLIITSTVHRMLLAESKAGEGAAAEAHPGVVDGMAFFEIGATKLKGIENFELVYAVYPEALAARFATQLPKI